MVGLDSPSNPNERLRSDRACAAVMGQETKLMAVGFPKGINKGINTAKMAKGINKNGLCLST